MTSEREVLLLWLEQEHGKYQQQKFKGFEDTNDQWLQEAEERGSGLSSESEWWRQLTQYIARARVHGLDSLHGRQAYMKFIATALGCGESMVRLFGLPPEPGHPSGEVREWELRK